jgi:predicted amidohydrolase
MARAITVAAGQLGPIRRAGTREGVLSRMRALLEQAAREQVGLVVFPELALTPFFPRWAIDDEVELAAFYESQVPGPGTQPLFEAARRLRVGMQLGYAEELREGGRTHRFNSTLLVDQDGRLVGRYRKVHLPGDREFRVGAAHQHLEKRYFETGDGGFQTWRAFGGVVGTLTCNDRRWPEAWRVLSLQGVELVLIGYNTPLHNPEAPELDRLVPFHHALVIQSGCYQNGTWAVAAAKAGLEEGQAMLGDSMIVSPQGEVVARAKTVGDELVVARIDLDDTAPVKTTIFDFAAHREPQHYGLIVQTRGAVPPGDTARGIGLAEG